MLAPQRGWNDPHPVSYLDHLLPTGEGKQILGRRRMAAALSPGAG
jgi:hypothetical protein